jgi:hypothetical protein
MGDLVATTLSVRREWQGRREDLQANGEGAKEFGVLIVEHEHLSERNEGRLEAIV